jgi:hypothetical protein
MTEVDILDNRATRNRILRRIAISLIIGAFAYGLTELTGQPAYLSLIVSVVLGGITLMVQFLMEFENRLTMVETSTAQHTARIEESVRVGFAKINDVTELFSLVEASALHTDAVTQLVRHSALLDPASPSLVFRFAQAEIARMSDFLKDLGEGGSVIYEGEDRDWLLALVRSAEQSIDATSLTTVDAGGTGYVDGGLWTTDLGQRYLQTQREAVQRGVRIRRIFVIVRPSGEVTDDDVLAVCRPQQEVGIEVRVLDSAGLPGNALFDFVLFDEAISYEVTPATRVDDSAPPAILNTRLELHTLRVHDRIQRFEHLWASAREVGAHGILPPPVHH